MIRLLTVFVCMFPAIAFAHTGANMGSGFMSGFTHPIFGLDHLLSMIAVGIISTQLPNKRAIWTLPATFVASMILGGYAGMSGAEVGFIETGIALSVVLLGTSIYFGSALPAKLIYGFVVFFGACHGFAHGAEMPEQAHPELFVGGFVLATILIHLVGVSIGLFTTRIAKAGNLLRFAGGVIAGLGISFIIGG